MDNAHYTGAPACIGFAVRACLIGAFIFCGFANALASQQVSAEAPVANVSSNEGDPYAEENEIIAEIFNDITGGGPMTVNLTLLFDKVEVDGVMKWKKRIHYDTEFIENNDTIRGLIKYMPGSPAPEYIYLEKGENFYDRYLTGISEEFIKQYDVEITEQENVKTVTYPYFTLTGPVNDSLYPAKYESARKGFKCKLVSIEAFTERYDANKGNSPKSARPRVPLYTKGDFELFRGDVQINACVRKTGQKLKVMSFNITHIIEHKTMQIGTHKWPGGRRIITKEDF